MSAPTFQDDLIKVMRKHRFVGLPRTTARTIRAAAQHHDQATLDDWLVRAVHCMLTASKEPRS